MHRLTLYTTSGCHLCEHAEAILDEQGHTYQTADIADDLDVEDRAEALPFPRGGVQAKPVVVPKGLGAHVALVFEVLFKAQFPKGPYTLFNPFLTLFTRV